MACYTPRPDPNACTRPFRPSCAVYRTSPRALHAPRCKRSLSVLSACLLLSLFAAACADAQVHVDHTESLLPYGDSLLDDSDKFGKCLAPVGDLDGDLIPDVAVGAPGDDGGIGGRGAVYLLELDSDGTVYDRHKISATEGGFGGTLAAGDAFGSSVVSLGDLDGDGIDDLLVGAPLDDYGPGDDLGAIWILFMNSNQTVKDEQKICYQIAYFEANLEEQDRFGTSVAALGDLDGNGFDEIVVSAPGDDAGGPSRGAVYILTLYPNGLVHSHRKISDTVGGFTGTLDDYDYFGSAIACAGDLNGDGVTDLFVSAPGDDDGSTNAGAVWVLFLNSDRTVLAHQKLSRTAGGLPWYIDGIGSSVTSIGDRDGDGVLDCAVGAEEFSGGGAVWILYLNSNGTAKDALEIREMYGGFEGELDPNDRFGAGVASVGDLNGDGAGDLMVGAILDDDGGANRGAAWVLFFDDQECVIHEQKISDTEGTLAAPPNPPWSDYGSALALLGDVDGDGVSDVAVGASGEWYGSNRGAVWVLFLNSDGTVKDHQKINDMVGGFTGDLDDDDLFGNSLAGLGDLDGDMVPDLAVCAPGDDDLEPNCGAVWVLFLTANGTVKSHQKISGGSGNFTGLIEGGDHFGSSATWLEDLELDTVGALAVGAIDDDDGGTSFGAVWVLFLNSNGTVRSHQKISSTAGGFGGLLSSDDGFGGESGALGDLDGDGVQDLAVCAGLDDDGGDDRGAVWTLLLNSDGTVKSYQKISDLEGGFEGILDDADGFGSSVAWLGDLENDGTPEIAVGATGDDDGGGSGAQGAVWILTLDADGTVLSHWKIGAAEGALSMLLEEGGEFGASVTSLGDFEGDGVPDFAAGADKASAGRFQNGVAHAIFLAANPPACEISPPALDFGRVGAGTSIGHGMEMSFSIRNVGGELLTGDVTEACDDFEITAGGGAFSLAANDSVSVTVKFMPPLPGEYECVISTGTGLCGDVGCFGIGGADYIQVVGGFNAWDADAPSMTFLGSGVWVDTLSIDADCYYLKFRTNQWWDIPRDYGGCTAEDPTCQVPMSGPICLAAGEGTAIGLVDFAITGDYAFTIDEFAMTYDIELVGSSGVVALPSPTVFRVYPALPNPSASDVRLRYDLPQSAWVTVRVFDITGRSVRLLENGARDPGRYSLVWDGRDAGGRRMAPGIYFSRIEAGARQETRRLIRAR
ncbi:MAG: FG-GAP repeat protein [Candidatus Eisenbacteria sp.]|nr:FG-GAP repeat protein [Candidatus Eisenbacteria bacterium]